MCDNTQESPYTYCTCTTCNCTSVLCVIYIYILCVCVCVCSALQHRPEDVDKRAADMYSYAVILWEIATNKIPFAGLSPMNIGIKVQCM